MHRFGLALGHLVLFSLLVFPVAGGAAPNDRPVDTTLLSFNIGPDIQNDGTDSWSERRYLVRRAIRDHQPAIFGLQGCLWSQGEELSKAFYGYRITGVGRDDGVRAGEMCLIFTSQERYQVLDQGFFWLSDTPAQPGSKSWGAAEPSIVTWVKLRDRWCNPDTLFVFNTHLDAQAETARREGSRLLQERLGLIAQQTPVVLMGDFSSPAESDSPAYRILVEEGYRFGIALRDCWFYAAKEQRQAGEGTVHGFSGRTDGPRTDWILSSAGFEGQGAGIDHLLIKGQYPSAHFPVWTTFRQERHPPLPGDEVDATTGATPKY